MYILIPNQRHHNKYMLVLLKGNFHINKQNVNHASSQYCTKHQVFFITKILYNKTSTN